MYKYIDNYVNTNHVTQFPYPLHLPLPLPISHFIPVILSRHLYVKHKTIVGNVTYSGRKRNLDTSKTKEKKLRLNRV